MNRPALCLFLALSLLQAAPPPPAAVTVQRLQDLDFGCALMGQGSGTLILNPDGARLPQGDLRVGKGQPQAAVFLLTGPPFAPFEVRVDPSLIPIPSSSGHLRAAEFRITTGGLRGMLDGTGRARITLGALLEVAAGTPPGVYRGPMVQLLLVIAGQPPASTWFQIRVCLESKLVLRVLQPLEFGHLLPGRRPGRIILDPAGMRSSPDPEGPLPLGGKVTAAQIQVQGTPGRSITIRLPDRVFLQGPGEALQLSGFASRPSGQALLSDGTCRIAVGGALAIQPNQAPGLYSGFFEVTVAYE